MTEVRRYSDSEVRRIFEDAASLAGQRRGSAADGMTLAELQDIAREVGLPPEHVADAAARIEPPASMPRRRQFGLPIGVGHVANMPRVPDDREWEIFLGEIRTTFGATGRDRSYGGLRHWSNGNLHIFIEPTEGAARLRMVTLKGNATAFNWLGAGWTVAGTAALLSFGMGTGGPIGLPVVFLSLGLGALLSNTLRLPRWAATRENQMIGLAGRARALLTAKSD
jgi:hypothetical protein